MANKKILVSATALALVALSVAPIAAADSLSRTFPEQLSAEITFDQGLGLFSTSNPDDTCLALLGLHIGLAGVFYYESLRLYPNLLPLDVAFPGVNTETLLPPGIDNDCLGLTGPTNELGFSSGQIRTSESTGLSVLTGVNQIVSLPTATWNMQICDFTAVGGTLGAPNALFPLAAGSALPTAGNACGAATDLSVYITAAALGSYGTEFAVPFFQDFIGGNGIVLGLVTGVTDSGVARSSSCASLTDILTGITTVECSHDWFAIVGALGDAQTAVTWTFDGITAPNQGHNVYNLEGDNGA